MGIIRKNYTDQFREEAVKLSESVGIAQAGHFVIDKCHLLALGLAQFKSLAGQ